MDSPPPDPGLCGTFPCERGGPLHRRHWPAASPTTGASGVPLVLVHGIGGHGGGFAGLASRLAAAGHDVYAPDLPGHGLSPGPRGWIPRWEEFRGCLRSFLDHLAAATGDHGAPVLLGHSLGGTVVLDLVLREPDRARGVILSNPALDAAGVAPWRLVAARSLSRLWPAFTLGTGIPLEAASRDPAVWARYATDPLRHDRCTARLGSEFLATATRLRRHAGALTLPLLVLQSGADTVTPPDGARRFFEAAGTKDKTWRLYPQSRHELHEDLDRDRVFEDILEWLATHGR